MDPLYRQKIRQDVVKKQGIQKKYFSNDFDLYELVKICIKRYFP